MVFSRRRTRDDKIFVNYRRDDAGGYAGRLSDSLSAHFGDDRVFRDVTGIDYGHDFARVIDERVAESCALLVLIGDRWLGAADRNGVRRLDDPDDYVCHEISSALNRDIAVIPVLIGEAAMPRREELPERLAGLARRNAITISDERWDFDVARLAKLLAIDVPGSVAQRRLDLMKTGALLLLLLSGLATIFAFCAALGAGGLAGVALKEAGFTPVVSAIPFVAIQLAAAMILSAVPAMEMRRRLYAWAAVLLAGAGTLAAFVYYTLNNVAMQTWTLVVNAGASFAIIIGMLALMMLAGFREK